MLVLKIFLSKMHKQHRKSKRNVAIHFAVLGPICWKVVVIAGTSYGDMYIPEQKGRYIEPKLNSVYDKQHV